MKSVINKWQALLPISNYRPVSKHLKLQQGVCKLSQEPSHHRNSQLYILYACLLPYYLKDSYLT